ncbi:Flp pilus assembly complex ATPase component TadA [Candidatus Sumerlaeota bacterium]|nr:Flp pilus assembly complex ATPase component TadA [Candidatus Sumerlaeota bacterium]
MAKAPESKPLELGRLLVARKELDPDDLERALREHYQTGERLGQILIRMGLATEESVLRALAEQLSIPYVRLSETEIPRDAIQRVPAKIATHYHLMPVGKADGSLRVAVSDPLDMHTLDDLRLIVGAEIEPVISTREEIEKAIKRYYGIGADTVEGMINEGRTETIEVERGSDVTDLEATAEDASIIRFVNQVITEALGSRATDIHVEPMEHDLRIRYRIDGLLYEAAVPPNLKRFQSAIISRIKIMADMNIAERRLPQDGKIKIKTGDRDYDLRVSTLPSPYGESVGIRILYRDAELINLERLGLDEYHLGILRQMISRPYGIILNTGPTGSGKSTTLYAALSEINKVDRKIISIEDPIEYRIVGVTQIQVNPVIDLTFARILRSVLRHDPDVILVGEVRDTETAEITIRTALTGHLVFSTLHTNDACGAVTRLLDMAIEPYLVASSCIGFIAQRLVRVLCSHCKAPTTISDDILHHLKIAPSDLEGVTIYRDVGCEHCRYTGFYGRTAIYEIVQVNESLKRLIVERQPSNVLRRDAMRHNMRPIREDGWLKIKRGMTTLNEVLRVTMEEEFSVRDE